MNVAYGSAPYPHPKKKPGFDAGLSLFDSIGARGFEPPTSCAQGRRASQAAPRPECSSLCHTLAMIVAVVFLVYAVLLFVEAGVSYRSSRAKPTLLAGICSGGIVVVAATLILIDVPIGASI